MKHFVFGYAAPSFALALALRADKQPASVELAGVRPATAVAVLRPIWSSQCGHKPARLGAA